MHCGHTCILWLTLKVQTRRLWKTIILENPSPQADWKAVHWWPKKQANPYGKTHVELQAFESNTWSVIYSGAKLSVFNFTLGGLLRYDRRYFVLSGLFPQMTAKTLKAFPPVGFSKLKAHESESKKDILSWHITMWMLCTWTKYKCCY